MMMLAASQKLRRDLADLVFMVCALLSQLANLYRVSIKGIRILVNKSEKNVKKLIFIDFLRIRCIIILNQYGLRSLSEHGNGKKINVYG